VRQEGIKKAEVEVKVKVRLVLRQFGEPFIQRDLWENGKTSSERRRASLPEASKSVTL
jgi:hypothetical protein